MKTTSQVGPPPEDPKALALRTLFHTALQMGSIRHSIRDRLQRILDATAKNEEALDALMAEQFELMQIEVRRLMRLRIKHTVAQQMFLNEGPT